MLDSGQKAVLGRIVEPSEPESCVRAEEPSVGGHPHSYCYEALIFGVRWPHDTDPACREKHMHAADFKRVMGMRYENFVGLPAWRRAELKKEAKLF